MNIDFRKKKIKKKLKMVNLVFFDILQLPHTVISNSAKLTHPSVQCTVARKKGDATFIQFSYLIYRLI